MRALYYITLFLLITPLISAEFYTTRSALINSSLSTTLTLENVQGNVSAYITFFPKTLKEQGVIISDATSNVPVSTRKETEEGMELTFTPKESAHISYNTHHLVQTFSRRPDLDSKPYPIKTNLTFFLLETSTINTQDEAVKTLAHELTSNKTDAIDATFTIANWVRDNIAYNLSTLTQDISRNASWVLEEKTGVCDELTVLFLALTRAAGIPSRYVSGIAHTTSSEFDYAWIPHAWAEVYFEDTGWVPFDITYGQFGWIDASHITMKTAGDTQDPSITYSWENGDIRLGDIIFSAEVLRQESINITPLHVTLHPLARYVYPGSIIPIRVTTKNPTDLRLSTTLYVEKAPGLLGSTSQPLLVDPQSEETTYFLIAIPDKADSSYDYSTPFVVADSFGARSSTSLDFSTTYGQITKKQADILVANDKKSREETTSTYAYLQCATDKSFYPTNTHGTLVCDITSKGGDLCIEGKCSTIEPGKKTITHQFIADTTKDINITLYTEEGNTVAYQHITTGDEGTLRIQAECPAWINSKETAEIIAHLESQDMVQDVFILVEGTQPVQAEDFTGSQDVHIKVQGSDLSTKEDTLIYATYSDSEGVRYETYTTCPISVGSMDLSIHIFRFFETLWNYISGN